MRVVREIPKNSREVLRVTLDSYCGTNVVDIRIWYHAYEEWRPSPRGITVSVAKLPAIADALAEAVALARQEGMLDSAATEPPGVGS